MVWQDGKRLDNLNIDSLEATNNFTSHIKYSTTKYLNELISKNSCLSDATKRLLYKYMLIVTFALIKLTDLILFTTFISILHYVTQLNEIFMYFTREQFFCKSAISFLTFNRGNIHLCISFQFNTAMNSIINIRECKGRSIHVCY